MQDKACRQAGESGQAVPKQIRVLIADDSDFCAAALRIHLSDHENIEMLAIARTGEQAVGLSKCLKPDLVLMDYRMPRMDGLLATHLIKQEPDPPVIIMVTMEPARARAVAADELSPDVICDKIEIGTRLWEMIEKFFPPE